MELRQTGATKPDLEALVDSIYALKEAAAALEDIRREVKKLYEFFERLACMCWTLKGDYEPIRTEKCTGSPEVKQTVVTPKYGSPEYELMREYFKIPEGVPFRPHWPSMLERISEDIAKGGNIPPGCDPSKMLPQYRVTIRNKKGVEPGVISDPELLKKQQNIMKAAAKTDPNDYAALNALAIMLKGLLHDQDAKNTEGSDDPKPESDEEENIF